MRHRFGSGGNSFHSHSTALNETEPIQMASPRDLVYEYGLLNLAHFEVELGLFTCELY
jgi:hypothetical protein